MKFVLLLQDSGIVCFIGQSYLCTGLLKMLHIYVKYTNIIYRSMIRNYMLLVKHLGNTLTY